MYAIDTGDLAGWAAVGAAVIGLGFTAWQLGLLRKQEEQRKTAEIKGVAVSWYVSSPSRSDSTGRAAWKYRFTAHNPGRLPIVDVRVTVDLNANWTRLRKDGTRDDDVKTIVLRVPVMAAGEKAEWRRNFQWPNEADDRAAIHKAIELVTARINFRDVDNHEWENVWPRSKPSAGMLEEETDDGPE
jgi:hypothetical protein